MTNAIEKASKAVVPWDNHWMSYAFWKEIIFTDLNADLSHKKPLYLPVRGNRISLTCNSFQSHPFQLHLTP